MNNSYPYRLPGPRVRLQQPRRRLCQRPPRRVELTGLAVYGSYAVLVLIGCAMVGIIR